MDRQAGHGKQAGSARRGRALLAIALSLLPLLALGCRPKAQPQTVGYFGPTEPMEVVVAQINANNRAIPTLWTRHSFEADIIDDNGRNNFINGDGVLMYRRPYELLINGSKPGVGQVFHMGTTEEEYWLLVPKQLQTMWWGRFENLGKPCVTEIPIRPDLLLEVLGVSEFDTNFLEQPAPVMRFNNDRDAYMFVWVLEGSNKLVPLKEIWYERESKLPVLVLLFDDNGRIILRAYLSNHRPVRVPGQPEDQWPRIATTYQLFFPDTQSRMTFTLDDPVLTRNGMPRAGGIRRPQQPDIPQQNVIQVDENCRD